MKSQFLRAACFLFLSQLPSLALAEVKAVHGLVIFGGEGLFASHIPMFMAPHDRQILIKIKGVHLTQAKATGIEAGSKLYTFKPKAFMLSALSQGTLKQIDGELFLGNFEQSDAVRIGEGKIEVDSILYDKALSNATAAPNEAAWLHYETDDAVYFVRILNKATDQDEIWSAQKLKTKLPMNQPQSKFATKTLRIGEQWQWQQGTWQTTATDGDIVLKARLSCLQGPDYFVACEALAAKAKP